jgi:hypothetical protein
MGPGGARIRPTGLVHGGHRHLLALDSRMTVRALAERLQFLPGRLDLGGGALSGISPLLQVKSSM